MKNNTNKHSVVILGAGKIGSLITGFLANCGDYKIYLGNNRLQEAKNLVHDLQLSNVTVSQVDAEIPTELNKWLANKNAETIISCLPYYCNKNVSDLAAKLNCHYFDLTEDVNVTRHVKAVAEGKNSIFMPQCGLAPGFISIAANSIMNEFDTIETVKMRVGALPINQNNTLKYSLTWSTDGLINEYGNKCYGIEDWKEVELLPLEGLESITLDGVSYEAFNTSGGLGTLADTYAGKVTSMNYKTIRYPGHCHDIKLLMNDLKLNEDRDTLKRILERAIPKTLQDVVLIYVSVTGHKNKLLYEKNMVRKIYPCEFLGRLWSSIQITTAAGLCAVMDITLSNAERYQGFLTQESISLESFLDNRFGQYYNEENNETREVDRAHEPLN